MAASGSEKACAKRGGKWIKDWWWWWGREGGGRGSWGSGGNRDGTDTGFSPCTSGEDDDDGFREEPLPPRSIRREQN